MMKTQLVFIFLVFLLKHKVTYASLWTEIQTQNVHLHGSSLGTHKVDTIFECYRKCEDNIHCASVNMNSIDKTCELKHSTKTKHQHEKSDEYNMVYMEIRDALGSSPQNPILSCKWFKSVDNQAKSGVYWMKFNEPSSVPFQVFCDMTTDGGGWTLVYSYTFTQYSNFGSASNAVTPIPNWPVDRSSGTWVPQSTTTPLVESSRSAMDFSLWKKIGTEFLVKPNISDWVACVDGTGSLVNWVTGSVTCRIVKGVTSSCPSLVPNKFTADTYCGPMLFDNGMFLIHFEGKVSDCFPIHDPCGFSYPVFNHLTNVPNPGGAVYIR